jgi:hypothetical protein
METSIESFAATLSEDERKLLHSSIAFASRVVASADSVVDKREESALASLADAARERLGAAFTVNLSDFPQAAAAADNPDWPQAAYVQSLSSVLRRMPPEARKTYDRFMIELVLSIARASGGILGFGEKLSADERYSIRRLISALELQIEDPVTRERLGY